MPINNIVRRAKIPNELSVISICHEGETKHNLSIWVPVSNRFNSFIAKYYFEKVNLQWVTSGTIAVRQVAHNLTFTANKGNLIAYYFAEFADLRW